MNRIATLSLLFSGVAVTGTVTAAPIAVTGYNTDLIAEGTGTLGTVTNGGVINSQQWVMAAAGYTGDGALTGTPLPVVADTVTTDSGTVYAVDPDANNALVNDGTLTLAAPGQYSGLSFFLFMVSGDVTATVNFADASSTVLQQAGISDWQSPNAFNAFAAANNAAETSSIRRLGSPGQKITLNPRELIFALSPADQAKIINSITFDFSSNDRSSVVAVSGTAVIPEPTSLALVGLGGLLIARRRRG